MENNILQNLLNALAINNNSPMQRSQPQTPLYPAEAYSNMQPQQQNNQNGLLPLLLSLFGQNNNADALGNILSGQNGDLSSVLSLISSLKKKKDENKVEKKEVPRQEECGLLPKDELL